MPLFKYVTLDRIDILVNQEIRYTPLGRRVREKGGTRGLSPSAS